MKYRVRLLEKNKEIMVPARNGFVLSRDFVHNAEIQKEKINRVTLQRKSCNIEISEMRVSIWISFGNQKIPSKQYLEYE